MDITESSDNSLESSRNESYQSANLDDAFIIASMEHISCDVTDEFQNKDVNSRVDELRELYSSSDTKYDLSDSTSYYQLLDRTKPANMVNVRKDSTELCEQQISNNATGLSNFQHGSNNQEQPKETRLSILLRDMLNKTLRRNCNTLETSTKTPIIVPTNIVPPDICKNSIFSSEERQTKFSLSPKQETCIKLITNGKGDISHSQNYCTTILEHSNETTHNQSMNQSSNWSRMFLTKLEDKKSCKRNKSEIYTEEDYSTDLTTSDDIEITRQESSLCSDLSFESTSSFNDAFLSASEVSFESRLQSTDENETFNNTTTTKNSISANSLKNNSPATLLVFPQGRRIKFTDFNKKWEVKKRRSRSVSDADEILFTSDLGGNSISKNSTRRSSNDCVIEEPITTVKQLILRFSRMPIDQENRPRTPLQNVRRRRKPMIFVAPASPF